MRTLTLLSLVGMAASLNLSLLTQNLTCDERHHFIHEMFVSQIDDFAALGMTSEQTEVLNAGMCNLSCEEFMVYARCINGELTAAHFQDCTNTSIPSIF